MAASHPTNQSSHHQTPVQNYIPADIEILKALLSTPMAISMLTNMVRKVVMKSTVSKLASIMIGQQLPMDATMGSALPSEMGVSTEGLEQPLIYWNPSIAPSGITYYLGKQFPQWKNNVFVEALKAQMLVRLDFENGRLKQKERLYRGEYGRILEAREGPNGALYLLTDLTHGQLLPITP